MKGKKLKIYLKIFKKTRKTYILQKHKKKRKKKRIENL